MPQLAKHKTILSNNSKLSVNTNTLCGERERGRPRHRRYSTVVLFGAMTMIKMKNALRYLMCL